MSYGGLTIGILELQGDFAEHRAMVESLGAKTVGVREVSHLTDNNLDGLIIPGGESTTIGKLLHETSMLSEIQRMSNEEELPIFGTCAGCILLAKGIKGYDDQVRLGLMDIVVDRNAYGSQVNSCVTRVNNSGSKVFEGDDDDDDGGLLEVVLIRAPQIVDVGEGVEVLAEYEGKAILVRDGGLLASTFHPELTRECRVHELFLGMALDRKRKRDVESVLV